MNKLLATLIAGTFAVATSYAIAQTPAQSQPKPDAVTAPGSAGMAKEAKKDPKGAAAAYANPGAEVRQEQKALQAEKNVDVSKMSPKDRAKYNEQAAQALSANSATDPAQAKANVAASKAQSPKREKMPDISKLTKEQQNELLRQLQKANTGG